MDKGALNSPSPYQGEEAVYQPHPLSPPLLDKERGTKGVRLINSLFPLVRGRGI